MGLPLTADLVRRHGGEIELASTQGHGARFDVILPIESAMELPERRGRSRDARTRRRARVLVIDDEPQLLNAFKRMLKRDHDVTVCRGGLEAKQRIGEEAYDVVVCDLMMPELDGKAIYDHIEHHAPSLLDRIVFCSGGAFTRRLREFLDSVPNICLDKPVETDLLLGIIDQIVSAASKDS